MGVLDGQPVDAAVTNPAFINKNQSDQMPNQLDFISAAGGFGPSVVNIQRAVNSIFSFLGENPSAAFNAVPPWASNNRGPSSDSIFLRAGNIDTAFDPVTGHKHTGAAGDGPPINASSVVGNIVRTIDVGVSMLTGDVAITGSGGVTVSASGNLITIAGGGGMAVYGTRASPELISAAGGITAHSDSRQLHFLAGSGGPVTITANPQISAGAATGNELILIGRDNTNTVTVSDGTGLSLNGDCILDQDNCLSLIWDGTNWTETSRRK